MLGKNSINCIQCFLFVDVFSSCMCMSVCSYRCRYRHRAKTGFLSVSRNYWKLEGTWINWKQPEKCSTRARLSRRRIAYGGLRRETAKEKVKEEKRRRLFFMVQQENCRVLSRYQPAGPCKASRTAKASQAGKLSLSLFRSTLFLAVFHYQASTCLWSASLDLYRLGMHIADTLFNRSRIVKISVNILLFPSFLLYFAFIMLGCSEQLVLTLFEFSTNFSLF